MIQVLELALTDDRIVCCSHFQRGKVDKFYFSCSTVAALVCNRLSIKSVVEVEEVNRILYLPGNDEARYTIYAPSIDLVPGENHTQHFYFPRQSTYLKYLKIQIRLILRIIIYSGKLTGYSQQSADEKIFQKMLTKIVWQL